MNRGLEPPALTALGDRAPRRARTEQAAEVVGRPARCEARRARSRRRDSQPLSASSSAQLAMLRA